MSRMATCGRSVDAAASPRRRRRPRWSRSRAGPASSPCCRRCRGCRRRSGRASRCRGGWAPNSSGTRVGDPAWKTAAGARSKRLPWPGPALVASTLPPCISTSRLTSVRPMPSPPARAPTSGRPGRTSRTPRAASVARDADAVVGDAQDGVAAVAQRRDVDPAAGRRVLGSVVEQVGDDLRQPRHVAVEDDPENRSRLDDELVAIARRSSAGSSRWRCAGRSPARSARAAARPCLARCG